MATPLLRIGSLHGGTMQGSNARIGTFVPTIHTPAGLARMAPCSWYVQFELPKRPVRVLSFQDGKVDWFVFAMVAFGMLPVVLVAIALFWR
jgi:hypothetical protein